MFLFYKYLIRKFEHIKGQLLKSIEAYFLKLFRYRAGSDTLNSYFAMTYSSVLDTNQLLFTARESTQGPLFSA